MALEEEHSQNPGKNGPPRGADLTLASHLPPTTRLQGLASRALPAPPEWWVGLDRASGPSPLKLCKSAGRAQV